MDNAPCGQTLNNLDDFLLINGRNFLKEILKQKIQDRIEQTEKTPDVAASGPIDCRTLRGLQSSQSGRSPTAGRQQKVGVTNS